MNSPVFKALRALAVAAGCAAPLAAGPAKAPAPFVVDHRESPHTVLRPLPLDAVTWTEGFWADRYRQLERVTLDESWRLLADPEQGHVLDNFRTAAGRGSAEFAGTEWQDEWLYKWLEAAACVWRRDRDPALARRMDEAIALIAAAQAPDGYLSTNIIDRHRRRFQDPRQHECYNMGHLITAGVIHRRMTGRDDLAAISRRAADFLCLHLGVDVPSYFAHNPSVLMAMVELYRDTGDKKYLACAERVVDDRGRHPRTAGLLSGVAGIAGTDMIQDRVPIRASREVVGHNVFFTYLYTGASDVYAETGDQPLDAALDRLWTDLTQRKMYLNGGVSAVPVGVSHGAPVNEAAGDDYELPNADGYNETCGQMGVFMWAYRRLVEHPEGQYADVMEREMFNGFLGAQDLAGEHWFYRNILRRNADYHATGWTDLEERGTPGPKAICCPSNLLRTIAELSAYFYSTDDQGLWVHQYGGNRVRAVLADGHTFELEQQTDYPWSGDVRLRILAAPATDVALRLRIPGWAGHASLTLGGSTWAAASDHGYATVRRTWHPGDTLTLSLPLEARLVEADPHVEADRNQVALTRGPVVYCAESPDLPAGVALTSVLLSNRAEFKPARGLPGVTGGLAAHLVVLQGSGLRQAEPAAGGALYHAVGTAPLRPIPLTLIPYFAWANRGRSAMSVWLPVAWSGASR